MALRGAQEPGAGASRGGGAGAPTFAGSGFLTGPVGPVGRRPWGLEGLALWRVMPWGGEKSPPSMDLPRRGVTLSGPWGPLRRGHGGRADTVLGRGGPWW